MTRFVPTAALLILAALAVACEDEGAGSCHAVDISEEECLARGRCVFLPTFFAYTDDQGCLLGDSIAWFPGRDLGLGVCVEAPEPIQNNIDNYNPQTRSCLGLSPNLHLVYQSPGPGGPRLGAGWTPCYYEHDWLFRAVDRDHYFSGDCRPTCGDGIVDPGESCEPSLPLPFETCEAAGDQLERDYTSGTLVCWSCALFLQCEAAP